MGVQGGGHLNARGQYLLAVEIIRYMEESL